MLTSINNLSDKKDWYEYFNDWAEVKYSSYIKCAKRSSGNKCWQDEGLKLEPKENIWKLKERYGLNIDGWYEREYDYRNLLLDKSLILPTFNNEFEKEKSITTSVFGGDDFLMPITFGQFDRLPPYKQNYDIMGDPMFHEIYSPFYKTQNFQFTLDEYQKTIDNNLIINYTIKHDFVKQIKSGNSFYGPTYNTVLFENTPEWLYFQISYDKPNNKNPNCSFSYPNNKQKDNVFWSNRQESFVTNFSGCDIDETKPVKIYFSMFSIPKWFNLPNDPTDEKNIQYKQDYLLQFDLSKNTDTNINLEKESFVKKEYPIYGKYNGIESIKKGFDTKKEIYNFTLSSELENINNYNLIKNIFTIKYTDQKNHHPINIPNKIFMEGTGSYTGLKIALKKEYIANNEYKYVVDDNTYYDSFKNKVFNGWHKKFNSYNGIVKNISSTNVNDGFDINFVSSGYSEKDISIFVPFHNNKLITVDSNVIPPRNLNFIPFEHNTKRFSEWIEFIKKEGEYINEK